MDAQANYVMSMIRCRCELSTDCQPQGSLHAYSEYPLPRSDHAGIRPFAAHMCNSSKLPPSIIPRSLQHILLILGYRPHSIHLESVSTFTQWQIHQFSTCRKRCSGKSAATTSTTTHGTRSCSSPLTIHPPEQMWSSIWPEEMMTMSVASWTHTGTSLPA